MPRHRRPRLLSIRSSASHAASQCEPTPKPPGPRFRLVGFRSDLERMAALYAIRMIRGGRLYGRMVCFGRIADSDLYTLLGIVEADDADDNLKPDQLRRIVDQQALRLESRVAPRLALIKRNVALLGEMVGLDEAERAVVLLATVISQVSAFSAMFDTVWPGSLSESYALIRYATGHGPAAIERACGPASRLRVLGFMADPVESLSARIVLATNERMRAMLSSRRFDPRSFLLHIVRQPQPTRLHLCDYEHIADAELMRRYVEAAVSDRQEGVNILIHGKPGTGKSAFVAVLAEACNLSLHEIPTECEGGYPITGTQRLRALGIAQKILSSEPDQLLLFDEVEDVFGSSDFDFNAWRRQGNSERMTKGSINHLLEENPVPTIWVSNGIRSIDAAHLRRFDLVVEFRQPTARVRRRIIDSYFPGNALSDQSRQALVRMESLPPARVERVARVVNALGSRSAAERDQTALQVARLSLDAIGERHPPAAPVIPAHYDTAFLNADRDLDSLVSGLQSGRPARLCLYGPPGTGKTALGHHLADLLDRPLMLRGAADLLSCWIGETEKNLARAFHEAAAEGAILLIDEADSFLQDRSGAQRSWEITQVNEMLTQMEAFEGLFIASTNLVNSLDAASLRRFDFKVKFDFLRPAQRIALFRRVLGDNVEPDELTLRRLAQLDQLVPGDFANVLRQFRALGMEPTSIRLIEGLEGEVQLKPGAGVRRIGFR